MKFNLKGLISKLKSEKERRLVPDYSNDNNIIIYLRENGQNISFQSINDDINLLVNLSNARFSEGMMSLVIPYQSIYQFYFDEDGNGINDYQLLNLPQLFDGVIYIQNNGNFVETDQVTYNFQFKDGREHDIRLFKENIILVDGQERLLTLEMYNCLQLIIKYNQDETRIRDISSQFEFLATIKDYAETTNLAFNHRLCLESKPIILDKIKLDFNKTDLGLEVKPVIEGKGEEFNNSFVSAFDQHSHIKNFYNIWENGADVKVVIKHKESAEKIKRNRLLFGEKEKDFYRGQNELLEDENFDLSEYGPRVKGLGYLNYRAIASPSNNSDESWFDFSQSYEPPSLYTDELVHAWRPEDEEKLRDKLAEMEKKQNKYSEIELQNEGETFRVQLTHEQLTNEINKISEAFIEPGRIRSLKDLREIRDKCEIDTNKLIIEYKGRFIKNYGKEFFEGQINK